MEQKLTPEQREKVIRLLKKGQKPYALSFTFNCPIEEIRSCSMEYMESLLSVKTGLTESQQQLYNALPEKFTRKEAVQVCVSIGQSVNAFEVAMRSQNFSSEIHRIAQGRYRKLK